MDYFEEFENMLKTLKDPTNNVKGFERLPPADKVYIHETVAFESRKQAKKIYKMTVGKNNKSLLLAVVLLLALSNKHERLKHNILGL